MTKRAHKKNDKNKNAIVPSDRGVDHFMDLEPWLVPEWVAWLHRQATFGFANKVTKTQVGFTIGPADREMVPELEDAMAVVLGYDAKH